MQWRPICIIFVALSLLTASLSGCDAPNKAPEINVQQATTIEHEVFQNYLTRHERHADEFTEPNIEKNWEGWIFTRHLKANSSSWISTFISHNGQYDIISIPDEDFVRAQERYRRRLSQ